MRLALKASLLAVMNILLSQVSSANAEPLPRKPKIENINGDMVIRYDIGGSIIYYGREFDQLVGQRIVIDGICNSACTIVLANPAACATRRAVFGFHKSTWYDDDGKVITRDAPQGDLMMWQRYPVHIRQKITAKIGLLSHRMEFIQGTDLIQECKDYQRTRSPN